MAETTQQANAQLSTYRAQIDAMDDELVRLLTARAEIVNRVKKLKDTHWRAACHIRPGREAQMHRAMFTRFAGTHLKAQAGAELWRMIISASTMIESPLNIACLPETESLAQVYFSALASYITTPSVSDFSSLLTRDEGLIVCLPYPLSEDALTLFDAHHDLRIFAYAPLVLKKTRTPRAVFAARLSCEPSGEDVSYFLHRGALEIIPGYHETHPNHPDARFIGAHGQPLTLEPS